MCAPREAYNQTKDRLKAYGLFSDKTIEIVAQVAQKQAAYTTYQDFFVDMGVPEPEFFYYTKRHAVHLVEVPPRVTTARADERVLVLHLPMGNPLDPNQLYQVATIAAANPTYRIVAFGNPSGKPYSFANQRRSPEEYRAIAFGHNKRALVAGELAYVASKNYHTVHHAGYSFGAHKALIASQHSPQNSVQSITLIDPVAHSRYALQLLGDFTRAFIPLGSYVNRTGIQSFFEAREDAKQLHFNRGLARPINLATGIMLARLDFIPLLKKTIAAQPKAPFTVAWGSKSEMGNDAHLRANFHNLRARKTHLRELRLEGDQHAFANDIHLHAAIITEALTAGE